MTREEKRIYDAAVLYSTANTPDNLSRLITAVMDLPMQQWPEKACEHKARSSNKLPPLIVHRGPKPQPGDAAMPDTLIDLETGERKAQ